MTVRTIEIDPRDIKLLELNARYMKHEEFNRLVENVRRDGQLTSTPFVCLDTDGRYLCLSGNHRTMAAIEVGLEKILCLATDEALTEDQRVAIQLSHNAIAGHDDPATLKLLYESILDTEMKKYSGLDDETLELLDKFSAVSISEANLQFQTVTMVFLPDELDAAKKVFGEAMERAKSADEIFLARTKDYDDWLNAQETVSSSYNVHNVATAVDLILRIFKRNQAQCAEAWQDEEDDKHWVPIESVIGRSKIPAESARVIRKALDKMIGKQEVTSKNLFQGLEYLAADYLAGG
jgi:ParB-like chromosome segregation protein Spo0J